MSSKKIIQLFGVHESEPLHYLPIFWLPIILCVGSAVLLTIPYWCLCLPDIGQYQAIFDNLKLPVLVASFSVPISVAVARIHSSKQAAHTLKLASSNSQFNKFYDHRKHFIEYIDNIKEPLKDAAQLEIVNAPRLYEYVFPKSSPDYFDTSISLTSLEDKIEAYKRSLLPRLREKFKTLDSRESKLRQLIELLAEPFGLRFTESGMKMCIGSFNASLKRKDIHSSQSCDQIARRIKTAIVKASEFTGRSRDPDLLTLAYFNALSHFIFQLEVNKWAVDGQSGYEKNEQSS